LAKNVKKHALRGERTAADHVVKKKKIEKTKRNVKKYRGPQKSTETQRGSISSETRVTELEGQTSGRGKHGLIEEAKFPERLPIAKRVGKDT